MMEFDKQKRDRRGTSLGEITRSALGVCRTRGAGRLAATINGSPFGENSKWWREAGAQLFKLKKLEWSAGT